MKKLILYTLSGLLLFAGCTTTTEGFEQAEALIVSHDTIEAEREASMVTIKVRSLVPYEIRNTGTWITPSVKRGDPGNSEFTLKIAKNETVDKRSVTITVQNQLYGLSHYITVTQKAGEPNISISKSSMETSVEGGNEAITITSNISWTASCSADWVTLSHKEGKKGETTLNITTKENVATVDRFATVKITNSEYNITKEIKISQGKFVPELKVDVTEISTTTLGETKPVWVTSNISWTASCDADWVTLSHTKGEKGETTLNITTKANAATTDRSATVKITNSEYNITKEIQISQAKLVPELTVVAEIVTSAASETKSVYITSNIPWAASCDADWVALSHTKGEKGKTALNITTKANAATSDRTATVKIANNEYGKTATINIKQYGYHVILYTSSNGKVAPYMSGGFGANIVFNTYANGQGEILFDRPITSIGNSAFYNCDSLTSLTIPDSVTSIGSSAFSNCTSLTSITIPDSVPSIGDYAFYDCTSLTSVTIPDSVTSIGYYAFGYCTSLTSITIPDSVTSIGGYAFRGCTSLTSVTIGNSVTSIGGYAFRGCTSLTSITIPNSVTSIGKYTFYGCTGELIINNKGLVETNYTYPYHPTNDWLYGSKFTKLTIGNSVTSIGGTAFYGCSSLTSVTIPDSVTSIGGTAFYKCTSLTSVTIPNSVTSIGTEAFEYCTSLTSVTIPNSVTLIGWRAFCGCESLKEVYCKPTDPPTAGLYYDRWRGFDDCAKDIKIYVPAASVEAYKSASGWSEEASYIVGYDF